MIQLHNKVLQFFSMVSVFMPFICKKMQAGAAVTKPAIGVMTTITSSVSWLYHGIKREGSFCTHLLPPLSFLLRRSLFMKIHGLVQNDYHNLNSFFFFAAAPLFKFNLAWRRRRPKQQQPSFLLGFSNRHGGFVGLQNGVLKLHLTRNHGAELRRDTLERQAASPWNSSSRSKQGHPKPFVCIFIALPKGESIGTVRLVVLYHWCYCWNSFAFWQKYKRPISARRCLNSNFYLLAI